MTTPDSTPPTAAEMIAFRRLDDFAALTNLFLEFGPSQSDQTIVRFVMHHTLPQLIALGWLRLVEGRWNSGHYTPAGELLAAVNGEDQFSE